MSCKPCQDRVLGGRKQEKCVLVCLPWPAEMALDQACMPPVGTIVTGCPFMVLGIFQAILCRSALPVSIRIVSIVSRLH